MRKKVLSILLLAIWVCNIYAEYTAKQLIGTEWQNINYKGREKRMFFTTDSIVYTYYMAKDTMCVSFPYYLSDEYTEKFDFSKVGKNNKGNYIVDYNPYIPEVTCREIKKFNSDSLVVFLRAMPHHVGGADMTVTYTRVKTEYE